MPAQEETVKTDQSATVSDKGGEMSNNSQSKVAGETNAGAMDTTIPNIVVERKISIDKNMNGKISDNEETILPSADIKTTITNNYAKFKKRRIKEKLVFVLSICTLVILSLSLMNIHWFLPYYYAIATPILLLVRIIMYSKNKWQYFLIDFCYFANVFCYLFIWAAPGNRETSVVLFAMSNGPLAWATVMFRNAMVFHDIDRMTSCYIHILPMAFSFGLRWYPVEMSTYWFTDFNDQYPIDIPYMFLWVFAVPLACFIFHNCLYLVIVYGICKPDDSYLNSLRYLSSKRKSWQGRCLYTFGQKYLLLTFSIFNLFYSSFSLILTILFYRFYEAHVAYMVVVMVIVTWNGASFYTDVFAVKGFKPQL